MFFFISNAKPLEQLSPIRPHPSIFNLYFFGSLIGQFAAQLAFLIFMYRAALGAMPEEEAQDSESDFKPNLVNSVCYLVEQTVQLSTFAVNYVGHPFNESLRENRGMRMSLTYAGGFLLLLVLEVVPQLNESFGLVPIPSELRANFIAGAVCTVLFCNGWERMLRNLVPARTPPARVFITHKAELQRARAAAGAAKKRE
ncbi:hypothetical protein MNEG_12219 [Monoraphidium neglectum]|uniref:Cation-transporting P-type ATPase C-terminal domain-containing protein n=1 Tax=Monoraphidium neglectum TaxID=145388 RepID=A0A0D2MLR1_9CHLO|nr:hypothetical protein MNEG_12219 [Monoraphidium neglectum]KIY95745.1 hypothetical protein MNEG_12219 [Monoraphidium neglectum]|eukprot:XP_013894765.1 hypothetical protein MNEG_12219 [Monoraphidium neglectum]